MFFLKNHVEKVKIENIKSNEVYAPVEGEVIPYHLKLNITER